MTHRNVVLGNVSNPEIQPTTMTAQYIDTDDDDSDVEDEFVFMMQEIIERPKDKKKSQKKAKRTATRVEAAKKRDATTAKAVEVKPTPKAQPKRSVGWDTRWDSTDSTNSEPTQGWG